jgi:hypothetical protein
MAAIMQQYGELVIEVAGLPAGADWKHRGFKPSIEGLRKDPHRLQWSEMPHRFLEWVESNQVPGFERAVQVIQTSHWRKASVCAHRDLGFERLITHVRGWTPARRRNSEGEYKIELRAYLESLKYNVKEEYGESNYDLLVQSAYAIEIKKAPVLAEYDRLFGQIARHLQHRPMVIVVIHGAVSGDTYDNFAALVDKYFNTGETSVEIIKK